LAEARINRELRSRFMQQTVSGTIDDDFAFPAGLREVMTFRVSLNGVWVEMIPLPPSQMVNMANGGGVNGYVVINDSLDDYTGLEYVLTYIERVPALSDTNTTTWLLTTEPGLYLYGALIEASPYLNDDGRVQLWAAQFKSIIEGMKREDDMARYGNSPQQMSPFINAP
jgi:hypothetical protein